MYGDDISSPFYFISVSSNGRTTVSKTVYLGSNPNAGANGWIAKRKGNGLQHLDRRFESDLKLQYGRVTQSW